MLNNITNWTKNKEVMTGWSFTDFHKTFRGTIGVKVQISELIIIIASQFSNHLVQNIDPKKSNFSALRICKRWEIIYTQIYCDMKDRFSYVRAKFWENPHKNLYTFNGPLMYVIVISIFFFFLGRHLQPLHLLKFHWGIDINYRLSLN